MRFGIGLAFAAMAAFASPALAQTPLTAANLGIETLADPAPAPEAGTLPVTASLAVLVAEHAGTETANEESECLARAVYWESRGEPLSGQLAVAEVIINRARSGRFAPTLCGVVRQPSQFSFVRRGYIPQPPQGSHDWQTAVAIARIATDRLAEGGAPQALFFHARRINPGWRLTRVATVGNHVFYR
jgi:spore germination cell wall hydrolase CwlJ-like protein